MKFKCCGIEYSTGNPETFECIETDIISKPLIKDYNGNLITKEVVYTLNCKKNGCIKVKIVRKGPSLYGKDKVLETVELSGTAATDYLQETEDIRKRLSQICPLKSIPTCTTIPYVYGKVIDSTTQRPRYTNESGFRDITETKVIRKYYRDEKQKLKLKKIIEYNHMPDMIESPVKILKEEPTPVKVILEKIIL